MNIETAPIPHAMLRQHLAILGKTGSGKTVTGKGAIERILRDDPDARACILDPIKSDWWGLTSSADGKRPGFPFQILGGPRGHVDLHPSAGAAVAELVASGELPLSILDMADFPAGGLQNFFNDFAPTLMRKMRGTLHLVLEEAHEFAPKERAGVGAENMTLYHAKRLATAGRSKGIRIMMLTQRVQQLHNSLLGSCEGVIIQRFTMPADQKPVEDWLKGSVPKDVFQQIAGSLASIKTGTGWVCSADAGEARLQRFPMIETFDNSKAPSSSTGEHKVVTAPVDRERLRAIVEAAGAKVAEVKDGNKVTATALDRAALNRGREEGMREGYERGMVDGVREGRRQAFDALAPIIASASEVITNPPDSPQAVGSADLNASSSPKPLKPKKTLSFPVSAPANGYASKDGHDLPAAAQKFLKVLDVNPPMWLSWSQVASLAKSKARGGSFNTARKSLLEAGLLEQSGDRVRILKPSGNVAAPSSLIEKINVWLGVLPSASARVLTIVAQHPNGIEKSAIARKLGIADRGGSWNTAWKMLTDNDLVEGAGGTVRLGGALKAG